MTKSKSIFLDIFGDTPLLRVTEFFLTYPNFDYTKSYVAKEVNISRITINKIWKKLVKTGVIIKSRALGKNEMWCLNKENPRVKVLMQTVVKLSISQIGGIKEQELIAHS